MLMLCQDGMDANGMDAIDLGANVAVRTPA